MLKESLKKGEAKEILPIAYAVHLLVNKVPVTMRSKEKPGVRIEKGEIVDDNYEGYVMKLAIKLGKTLRVSATMGPYTGLPVIVVPIKDGDEVLGAIGVVDVTAGIFEDVLALSRRPELYKFLPDDAYPKM
ncbi:DUF2111 domain-containing protein [Methanothermococcus okinawensis]|uniref:Uncharacterized conserved protein UCP006557, signal transduction n=1 Tax=Methanothermococcus okinawensis (strain DSM 14208 / JCM 11175 / IH1) TaxID=647113 RepID=F8ALM1_METOI|nr:DUF2111 domain-containing protein [Methanothermococcus okinawensis]AEH06569.1 Uncharacterized conserved protein UCP006557, signal transduction [Methanothermococcus okinawensis IH1]